MKKRVNLNPSSLADRKLAKSSVKERAKALANAEMPDEWDRDNIDKAIKLFERKYPGMIYRMAVQVQKEVEASDIDKHATISQDSDFRRAFWLPAPLQKFMEDSYPSIAFGKNKRHVNWFIRNFEVFSYQYYAKRTKVR